MKLLVNENIPRASVLALRKLGYDVKAVGEDYQGVSNQDVMKTAEKEQRLIITFDADYGTLIFKHHLTPAQGVIYLRLSSYTPDEPAQFIHQLLSLPGLKTAGSLTVYDGQTIRQRKYR